MVTYLHITICMCFAVVTVGASPWASPAQEKLDELNDAEIYDAVFKSMNEWERHRNSRKTHGRVKREESSVCYADLGCFEASGPFGYLDMLPSTPEEIDTKFLMYPGHSKRRSGNPPGEIPFKNLTDAFTWAKQGFNNTLPTKVMIHGFGSDCSHVWVYEMRSALMAVDEVNVICVDWGKGATLPNYVKATANTRLVGKQLAMLLRGLKEQVGISLRNMHLIGFSLGAHVAGFAGAELGNLSRITGLDPAGPLFESQDPRARLDQTDAAFVDVIHSNGENLILGGLGSWQPMGHVDFYPNGGRMQKGCSNIFVGAVSDIIWSSAVEGRSLCNHRRAYKFFTDSVSPRCHFPAFPCNSYDDFLAGNCFPCTEESKCGNMGYYADRSKGRGQLYLITRDEEPFCAHQYHIKIESSPSDVPIVSYGKIQITLIGDSLLNETFTLTRKEDEEMKLGSSVSRIIVPHPILLEPTKIQILYYAYSGWLTSGLLQWRIDKITLSDSFGRSSSVCKKSLLLDSGQPVILPLYPGECNLPRDDSLAAEDRIDEKSKNYTYEKHAQSKFVPTPVVKIGSELIHNNKDNNQELNSILIKDALDILNIPWSGDKDNSLDGETEQSRAFNTRVVKMTRSHNNFTNDDQREIVREVVEPILKPHSVKIGRSHNPNREKPEITEPILGPTTIKTIPSTSKTSAKLKEITYNFYDVDNNSDWVPAINPTIKATESKWKRQDESKVITNQEDEVDAFNAIIRTVQFLPQRLARMFEEAEKYARETILPFVSTYTPRFLTDFIQPRETSTPRYLPLKYEESTARIIQSSTTTKRKDILEKNKAFDPPPIIRPQLIKTDSETTTENIASTTGATNIQKIGRKLVDDKIDIVYATTQISGIQLLVMNSTEEALLNTNTTIKPLVSTTKPSNITVKPTMSTIKPLVTSTQATVVTTKSVIAITSPALKPILAVTNPTLVTSDTSTIKNGIYIDLPIFEGDNKEIKYIPLVRDEKSNRKKSR